MEFSIPKIDGWRCPVHMISSYTGLNIDLVWKESVKFKDTMRPFIVEK